MAANGKSSNIDWSQTQILRSPRVLCLVVLCHMELQIFSKSENFKFCKVVSVKRAAVNSSLAGRCPRVISDSNSNRTPPEAAVRAAPQDIVFWLWHDGQHKTQCNTKYCIVRDQSGGRFANPRLWRFHRLAVICSFQNGQFIRGPIVGVCVRSRD